MQLCTNSALKLHAPSKMHVRLLTAQTYCTQHFWLNGISAQMSVPSV